MTHIGVHVGSDWWTHVNTYEDHAPILDIDAGSTSVAICFTGNKADASAVEFSRELAAKTATFAAEVERLHARHSGDGRAPDQAAGAGEAA
jgi:hypothetical protein